MINKFEGRNHFLSNFYGASILYNGVPYLNNEAAFQPQKTENVSIQEDFSQLNPSIAKREGRCISLRHDWEEVKKELSEEESYFTVIATIVMLVGVIGLQRGDYSMLNLFFLPVVVALFLIYW